MSENTISQNDEYATSILPRDSKILKIKNNKDKTYNVAQPNSIRSIYVLYAIKSLCNPTANEIREFLETKDIYLVKININASLAYLRSRNYTIQVYIDKRNTTNDSSYYQHMLTNKGEKDLKNIIEAYRKLM